jgi:prepilin-type N-terminal cleavage/methylation domain-containing protein
MEKARLSVISGFTLIEIMIATMLLGLILGIATRAGSNFMHIWQNDANLFSNVFDSTRHQMLLGNSIESLYGYYVKATTGAWGEEKYVPFFKGDSKGLEFVTLSSVFSHGDPAVARLYAEEKDSGKYDLIYQEADLDLFFIRTWEDSVPYTKKTAILTNLERVDFRYYGISETQVDPQLMIVNEKYGWDSRFSGKQSGLLPHKIEITIHFPTNGEQKIVYEIIAKSDYKTRLFNEPFRH